MPSNKLLPIPKSSTVGLRFDAELIEEINKYIYDPLGYVMFIFPWDTDFSIQKVEMAPKYQERFGLKYGPDVWACEFLDQLGEELAKRKFDGRNAVPPVRFSTASGHGIGKSTLVAWLIKFILDTRPLSKGIVTASTAEQLRTKTWAEVAKWNALSLTAHLWHYTNSRGSMSLYRKGNNELRSAWRCDALTCKEENSESFAGLHAAGGSPFYIFDEASGIPDAIFEVRGGGATDGEPMWFDFGNPTRKSGYFYENTIGKFRHRFITRCIDSRTVAITSKAYIQEILEDYGEDSDYFKVRVKGEFPSAGSVQFISDDLVGAAVLNLAIHTKSDPLVIGVDVARFGDDATIIYPRIGMDARSFPYQMYRGLDNVQVAEKVVEAIDEFRKLGRKCAGLFIDGGGLGGGVVDILRKYGYNPIDVNFGSAATDRRYRFRSDEMWGRMKDALPRMAIPNDDRLRNQLIQREYDYNLNGKIQLESKKDMKERGLESPDIADALALTFATTVATSDHLLSLVRPNVISDYDPLEQRW